MSLRLEMLQVARLAPKSLAESAGLVGEFIRSQAAGGGFVDRAGNPDPYYTVFGLESLRALSLEISADETSRYLRAFGDGAGLDFVHLTCLIRCWANVRRAVPEELRLPLLRRLESFRMADGGFSPRSDAPSSVYGCFLALGAYQDLAETLPDFAAMVRCVKALRAADGGYSNQHGSPTGMTSATAAAATIFRHAGEESPDGLADWLLARCHHDGGFFASPAAPIPDLLSTATALHALDGLHAPLEPIREACLDFVDSLWTNRGGFFGHWSDDAVDCEYTYYGLLALGHLSL